MNRDRYLRQQAIEGLGVERLARMRVVVAGAGAVGNEVVKNLALTGVGRLDVHDFDRVELHNLTRSVFLRESDVGRPKAAAVAARAAEVDPNVRIRAIEGDAWRTLTLAGLYGCDALVAAVDSLEARMKLSQLAQIARVDFVTAGIDSRYATVEAFPYARGEAPACYECHLPESAYRKVAERYSCGWLRRALHAEATVPTTAITASVAGALAVQAVLRPDEAAGASRVLVDTRGGTASRVALARNAECPGCGLLVPRPRRVAARGDWRSALSTHAPGAAFVTLSDALIFGYACTACGATDVSRTYVGHAAAEFDDRITRCASCGELAVRIDVRAEARVDELAALCGRTPPPAKFLLANAGSGDAVCLDLEE
ncbi:MAG: ThiF family adenylyltransferase [Betaproteobacteria bacterium]|nr:ThiF family adenylyltransferase [Betaproteobacteria bacterium]MDH5287676.1 ThiF family adenylyltransferase [Betaproteobacteria bacterium]